MNIASFKVSSPKSLTAINLFYLSKTWNTLSHVSEVRSKSFHAVNASVICHVFVAFSRLKLKKIVLCQQHQTGFRDTQICKLVAIMEMSFSHL